MLDSGSTVNIFCNLKLLTNIKNVGRGTWVHCNGGTCNTYDAGTLDGYGKLWLCRGGTKNILYLSRVIDVHPVTLESRRFAVKRDRVNNISQEQ